MNSRQSFAVVAFIATLLLVLMIAFAQRWGWLDGVNQGLMHLAGRWRGVGGPFTSAMSALSLIGDTPGRITILAAIAAGMIVRRQRALALWFAATVLAGTLLNVAIKQIFAAPRPDLLPHLDIVTSYSFPSGHAAGAMVLWGAIAMMAGRRAIWVACGTIILLTGISRVWLGVHWPSDVTAGWIEGAGWLMLCRTWRPQGSRG